MSHKSLLIEFLTEELPPINLETAVGNNFSQTLFQELKGFVMPDSQITTILSPRRFGCLISNVKNSEDARENLRKGPAISNAFKDNNPTPALLGFAKSCKQDYQDLIKGDDGYFYAKENLVGRSLNVVLYNAINNALRKLTVSKYMHWGSHEFSFIRPVHNLILMHGTDVISLNEPILGLMPNNKMFGHRIMSDGAIVLSNVTDYLSTIESQGKVMPLFKTRRNLIEQKLQTTAQDLHLSVHEIPGLLDEVTALVEYPVILQGEFAFEFLAVPQECLILSMAKNQKYFALVDATGKLSNKFLFVANINSPKPEIIIKGNEKVLSARLSDAKFFFDVDKKIPLKLQTKKLANVLYHNKLGSQAKRNERLAYIAKNLASILGVPTDLAVHTANLLKADLVTEMVGEFPELQGVMGKYYALNDGETVEVANAIEQHYYPRFSGDMLPDGKLATLMSLTDKLDTLVGIWGIGLIPTGDKDPYALRRAALGIVRILLNHDLDLVNLLNITFASFDSELNLKNDTVNQVTNYIFDRLENYLKDTYETSYIKSILARKLKLRFDRILILLDVLKDFATNPKNKPILEANKRIENILSKYFENNALINIKELKISWSPSDISQTLFEYEEEHKLYEVLKTEPEFYESKKKIDDNTQSVKNWYQDYFDYLAKYNLAITAFFDNVMVMVDDENIRKNRIMLLTRLYLSFNSFAQLSELS